MKRVAMGVLLCSLLPLIGCSPLENQARDTAAALSGSIAAAQSMYQARCAANPAEEICQVINRGVAGENALITAVETYCGWSAAVDPNGPRADPSGREGVAPPDPTAACVPVKSAQAALKAAIANAASLTLQIKGAL